MMFNEIKDTLEQEMNEAIESLKRQFMRVRTGRASIEALDGISVDYYGALTPLKQMGQISIPEARLLQIRPFDKTTIATIEKAILKANLGLTPSNDGNLIRIPFPALTEERRKEQIKNIRKLGEEGKIHIRNARRDQNDKVKKMEKSKEISEDDCKKWQSEIQTITDEFVKKIEDIMKLKEEELLTI